MTLALHRSGCMDLQSDLMLAYAVQEDYTSPAGHAGGRSLTSEGIHAEVDNLQTVQHCQIIGQGPCKDNVMLRCLRSRNLRYVQVRCG